MSAPLALLRRLWRRLFPAPERPELVHLADALRTQLVAFREDLSAVRDSAGRVSQALDRHRASLGAVRTSLEGVTLEVRLALERSSSNSRDLVHRVDALGAILQADADAPRRLAERTGRMRRRAILLCLAATGFLAAGGSLVAVALARLAQRAP